MDTLFVARGVRVWGSYDVEKRKMKPQSDQKSSPKNGNEDLLNLAAVQAYLNGGKVFVVDPQEVPDSKQAAAIFRY